MNPVEELETRLDSFGRPKPDLSSPKAILTSLDAMRAWDAAHPAAAAEYRELADAHHQALKELEAREAQAREAERVLRLAGLRLERSGVGERSLAVAREATQTRSVWIAREWLAVPESSWLVLCGPKGVGKTVALTWLVAEAIKRGDTAAFRRASELARLSLFDAGVAEFRSLARVGLLAIDELGAENLTDHARSVFHELLDRRHESPELRTVISTNLRASALSERIGERLVDRIQQAGIFREVGGESLRGKAGGA